MKIERAGTVTLECEDEVDAFASLLRRMHAQNFVLTEDEQKLFIRLYASFC